PWETIRPELAGTKLAERPDGLLQLKTKGERCRFLDENRHCLIHKTIGRQVFSSCAVFPYSFAETPEGVAVSASFVCGSARHNLGAPLDANPEDLHFRMAQIKAMRPKG